MRISDTDVIIVGAGPTGLMLAAELRLAWVRPVVLERSPQLRTVPKANGLGGQILQLLDYRGLSGRLAEIGTDAGPIAALPFGDMHVDFTPLADSPLRAMHLPQPKLEQLLDDRANELGAQVWRGHEVTGIEQDDTGVTVDVRGPDGEYRLGASYVVACDGARSRVRAVAGIDFPGITYPEVNRLGQVSVPDSVTVLDDGAIEVACARSPSSGPIAWTSAPPPPPTAPPTPCSSAPTPTSPGPQRSARIRTRRHRRCGTPSPPGSARPCRSRRIRSATDGFGSGQRLTGSAIRLIRPARALGPSPFPAFNSGCHETAWKEREMTEYVTLEHGRIACDVIGDGPLVVLSHGMGTHRRDFRNLAGPLAAAGYRVVNADMRGHGESSLDWPSVTGKAAISRTDVALDLLGVIRHFGGPAVIVGHSLSGGSATIAAAEAPELVSAIVEINPFTLTQSVDLGALWSDRRHRIGMWQLVGTQLFGSPRLWFAYLEGVAYPTEPIDHDDYLTGLRHLLREPGRWAEFMKTGRTTPADAEARMAEVRCPALVIMGAEDPDYPHPEAEGRAIVSALPPGLGQLTVVDRGGHYPHAQFPERTAALIIPFLNRHTTPNVAGSISN